MPDQSFLDEHYFVDNHIYNCPFCNRRHVAYSIYDHQSFDWTENKRCRVFFVQCHSCGHRSMHLSFAELHREHLGRRGRQDHWCFDLTNEQKKKKLDDFFFYSVPTSFFSLDSRVPRVLRELLTEAEGCLKGNFLTGASACARKIIYELAELNELGEGNYDDRIRLLKAKYEDIEQTYFDTLLSIQRATSAKVHERAYDGWKSQHVRLILASIREVLHELYVMPALREDRRRAIIELEEELLEKNRPDVQ